jgi:signal transduction histidine kinase
LLAAWTLRRALRPVPEMTRLAGEWSDRDPDRRFAQGPPHDELTDLAATLDRLLTRLAASLRREQRFSAELAHELRTPLARIAAESELALRAPHTDPESRDAFAAIGRNADEMRRTIDVLVAAARHQAGHQRGATDTGELLTTLARRATAVAAGRALEVDATHDGPTRVAVDADLAARIIEPVIDNALLYAATRVTLTASGEDGSVVFVVGDDGPGVDRDEQARIFNAGERGATARGSGAGLGLALARRLASDVSGTIDLLPSTSGARFRIRLPRA